MSLATDRYVGLDLLRAIAAFGIVGRHLNLTPMTRAGEILLNYTDLNVGVFGAISGFFIAKSLFGVEDFQLLAFLKRRTKRIIPMYLIWTLVYLAFGFCFGLVLKGGINPKFMVPSYWIESLFLGGASCHLWYLAALFYSTVFVALAFKFVPAVVRNIGVLGLASIGMLYLANNSEYDWVHTYFCRLCSYVALGMLLYRAEGRVRRWPIILVLLCLAASLIGRTMLVRYCGWFVLDYAVVVPLILLAVRWVGVESKRVQFFATTSLGVYLIHPIFAAGFNVVMTRLSGGTFNAGFLLADWVLVWVISLLIAAFLNRYDGTKQLMGNER